MNLQHDDQMRAEAAFAPDDGLTKAIYRPVGIDRPAQPVAPAFDAIPGRETMSPRKSAKAL